MKKPDSKKAPAQKSPVAAQARGRVDFPVVAIGASAGGLDAFKQFFSAMPADSGMAFVLIQHLDPTHESLMADLLSRYTRMKVMQVEDRMPVRSDCVYMIPPGKSLALSDGVLQLTDPVMRRGMRMPIDFFFRSLAEGQREKAICIVLSGTGTDGTLGLQAIKANGGMTMAQDPATAQYDGMPRSAEATGMVDYLLPIEKMPETLLKYVGHFYIQAVESSAPATKEPDHLQSVLAVLHARTKHDFRCYKKGTLRRRIERRMGINHVERIAEYLMLIRESPNEATLLFKDLLIGVTGFFREPEAFKVLEQEVIPALVRERSGDAPVRVWVPGCASGEEPYSIAMLLIEQLQVARRSLDLQIFGTDIDQDALEFARTAIYPESIGADITPERLQQLFDKEGERYRVVKRVRESVVFAVQNLIADPPFSKLDLISCRNLLIYLEPEVQKKLIALFHFALNEGGYLFLGNSETVGHQDDLFEPVSKKWRVYRRIGVVRRDRVVFPAAATAWDRSRESGAAPQPLAARKPTHGDITRELLLEEYGPAAVLINRKYEILHFFGPTEKYLKLPDGAAVLDLIEMLREGLRTKLRAAVHKAMRDGSRVEVGDARVRRDGGYFPVRIRVRPAKAAQGAEGLLLVAFEDVQPAEPQALAGAEPTNAEDVLSQQLEHELKSTKEDLQSTIEELETSNEELKASNEEVMSMNEELQSTNEELETSKEELQSLNEELSTVNNQLQDKVEELEATNDDLANLLSSTDIATLFLDTELRIRRYTPAATRLIKLISTDIGRPLGDIAQEFDARELVSEAQTVLRQLAPVECEVGTDGGQWFLRRILPYRTKDNRINGVVVTFTDVSESKRTGEELRILNENLEQRVAERTGYLALLHDVATVANQARTLDEAYQTILDQVCRRMEWPVGHVCKPHGDDEAAFSDSGLWSLHPPERFQDLLHASREVTFIPGEGMVGQVIATGEPEWLTEVASHELCVRSKAVADLGLQTVFLFPVLVGERVVAVLEFFATQALSPDHALIDVGAQVGTLLGRVYERTQAEERLRKLSEAVEQSPNAVVITDRAGTIEYVNPAFSRVTGYGLDEAIGQNPRLIKGDETPRAVYKELWRTITAGGTWRGEFHNRKKDGTLYWDYAAITPILDGAGKITHFLGIQTNITERKEAEERARQRDSELAHMSRLNTMGEMASMLAHELNQPLTAIVGYTTGAARRLRAQREADPELLQVLDHTAEVAKRAAEIVGGIRKFIRKEDNAPQPVHINAVVREVLDLLGTEARRSGIAIETDLASGLPAVEGDTIQLEQVLLNLVRNGIDAMETVTDRARLLSLRTLINGEGELEILVRDTGVGLPAQEAPRLFDAFVTTKSNGLGLGLSISRTIVEAHGGRIWAETGGDQGAVLHVSLPVPKA
ncbi:MAG: PAS domain S-box protein [Chromatiaceae bacterium]|nr:PAS domain S-box protein [Chromatiaceae bacterium]